jgi:2-dehydro-3-deoxyphosphooctonate aldolase (KDO 8-P synthase)
LITDMRALAIMRDTGCPVVFDATHSGAAAGARNVVGRAARVRAGAQRAAIAAGVAGLF